jgi:hypothetical protein
MVVHRKGYNLADLNKDLVLIQHEKNLKIFGGVGNPTLSSFGCFTPPSESQAITTLKKRSAIA